MAQEIERKFLVSGEFKSLATKVSVRECREDGARAGARQSGLSDHQGQERCGGAKPVRVGEGDFGSGRVVAAPSVRAWDCRQDSLSCGFRRTYFRSR